MRPLPERASLLPRDEAVERIAAALDVRPSEVRVDRWSRNERRTAVHAWGSARGRDFFAKILVTDSFPRLAPIVLPTDAPHGERGDTCTAVEQIETERAASGRFAGLGGLAVPALLGCAPRERAIVWRAVPGRTLDALLRRSRYAPEAGRDLAAGLQRAGLWVRRLHDTTRSGSTVVEIGALTTGLSRFGTTMPRERDAYTRIATEVVDSAVRAIGTAQLEVLRALTHGDLSPPNLLWNRSAAEGFVVDFEHSLERPVIHDLVLLLANLRAKLLNPLVPHRDVIRGEQAFWNGYGPIRSEEKVLVESLASAWVFYRFLPGLPTRASREGLSRRLLTAVYGILFERSRTARVLSGHVAFLERLRMQNKTTGEVL
jgi:hypothetical protein